MRTLDCSAMWKPNHLPCHIKRMLSDFFVAAPRTCLAGLQSTVTILPHLNYKIEGLIHSCLYPHARGKLQIKTTCQKKDNCRSTAYASSLDAQIGLWLIFSLKQISCSYFRSKAAKEQNDSRRCFGHSTQ